MKKHSYDVEEADFDELVVARSHEVPVLLDIGAEWCSPCRVLGPMLEKLSAEYDGKFVLAKVDADENMKIGRHCQKPARQPGQNRLHSAQPLHFYAAYWRTGSNIGKTVVPQAGCCFIRVE
jgi:putative thioredoxin